MGFSNPYMDKVPQNEIEMPDFYGKSFDKM